MSFENLTKYLFSSFEKTIEFAASKKIPHLQKFLCHIIMSKLLNTKIITSYYNFLGKMLDFV